METRLRFPSNSTGSNQNGILFSNYFPGFYWGVWITGNVLNMQMVVLPSDLRVTNIPFVINKDYELAISRKSGILYMFVDKVLKTTANFNVSLNGTQNIFFGRQPSPSDYFLNAIVSYAAITVGQAKYTSDYVNGIHKVVAWR
jgi:hypothetical protein